MTEHMTPPTDAGALERLVTEIRACTTCANVLPLGPRPILHVSPTARILIASQAPGTRVHETGQSFNDASGDRLRGWLGIDRATFYDSARIAIMPMGMCYPGRLPKGGDCPPRRECAPLWRERVLALMPDIRLTLLVGSYAQNHVLGPGKVEDRVRHYRDYLPRFFPLPHPSWRTGAWERRSPWFGTDVLPALRREVHAFL
ncbi:uracil-DNA glycosylase [Novacetimonas hansenii NRIC 0243]|nr:uracil-DNA glycosylase [Novacetimonas hansenii NRIC 0243]